jgi:hypothetical protein
MITMKTTLLTLIFILAASVTTLSQNEGGKTAQIPEQADLLNEFSLSYGLGSFLHVVGQTAGDTYKSPGTFNLGYTRSINKTIGVGFHLGYVYVEHKTKATTYSPSYTYQDGYLQGLAFLKFRYLNKPVFCMYSGIGLGVMLDYYSDITTTETISGQKIFPAGQLTLLGFRAGRSLAFFGEFGLGTLQILNAGISYKFGD